MNIKKNLPKVLSAAMSLTIVCSTVGVTAYSAGVEKAGGTKPAVSAEADSKKSASDGKAEKKVSYNKEETVYVIADAQGNPDKVIVSDWIQNTSGASKISDKTNLKDIENVKGDESFTLDENNACEWSADGNDIYYRGTGSTQLPVGVGIRYELDGKAVAPKELAGKSGKLKIKITYTNRQYEEVKINGKKQKIYVPFVMLTGMMLDNEKVKNVSVSNGKVINDGSHTYVAGFALPGVQESLALDKDKLDIPSSVEITAEVKDFELATTLTVATNELFNDIDVSKIDDTLDDLNKKLSELSSATTKLLDGSSQLYDGLSTLLDKSGELIDGVNKLYDGSKQLKDGSSQLSDGSKKLKDGAAELDNGMGELSNGAGKLSSGAGSLSSGASQVDNGAGSLSNGANQLSSGAGDLSNGAAKLDSGVAQLQGYIASLSGGLSQISANSSQLTQGAKQVFETLLSTADTQIAAAGLETQKLTIGNYRSVLTNLINSLSEENAKAIAKSKALETVTATVNSQKDVIRAGVENAVRKQVTEGVLAAAGLSMSADAYDKAVAAGQIPEETQAQISTAVSAQMAGMDSVIESNTQTQIQNLIDTNMQSEEVQSRISEGAAQAAAGRKSLEALKTQLDSYNKFYEGILSYTAGVDQANDGAKEILNGTNTLKNGSSGLKNGASTLKNGTDSLKNGAGQLKSGTGSLKSGASQLSSGAGDLKSGAAKLKDGTSQLKSGTSNLYNGAVQLNSGAVQLYNGIGTFKNGTSALIDGVTKLKDGSMQLNKGLKEFKKQGTDKLKEAVDGEVSELVDRIKAISKVSKSYKSFSGISDGADGKVDFIFKTDGIEK